MGLLVVIWNQMRRFKVITVLVVVAAVLAGYFLLRPNLTQARQGVIELTNLPDQYCPLLAETVVTDATTKNPTIITDRTVKILECRYIVLSELMDKSNTARQIAIKIPGALAISIGIDSTRGHYQYAPTLGDVNDDNIIDLSDESQVSLALFSSDPTLISTSDLDYDGKVSVLDLSFTRINHRTGINRPDNKNWGNL